MQPHHRTGFSSADRSPWGRTEFDVDASVAAFLGVPAAVRKQPDLEPFDAAAVSTATAVLVQMQLAMRLAPDDSVVDTVGDIYERAVTMAGVPSNVVGAAASLVDNVRDNDHAAIAVGLMHSSTHFGTDGVLTALSALMASFTSHLADQLDIEPCDAHAEVVRHRHSLGMQRHRTFCRAHAAAR